MDFYYLVGAISYITVIVIIGAALPTSYFEQVKIDAHNFNAYSPYGSVNESAHVVGGMINEVSFFLKMVKFLFVPILVSGLPLVLAIIIMVVNYVAMIIPVIFLADYLRGRS